jgi:Tfp pilus assembly protein PilN
MTTPSHDLSPESLAQLLSLVRWLIGAIGGVGAVVLAAVGWLVRVSYRMGERNRELQELADEIKETAASLAEVKKALGKVDHLELETRLLRASTEEVRRRMSSDFPEMKEKVAALWAKVFSLNQWRKSHTNEG